MRPTRSMLHSLCLVFCILTGLSSHPACGVEPVSSWMNLSQLTFNVPDASGVKEYLGLKEQASFTLVQIPAKFILIECLSLDRPNCDEQAAVAIKLYKFIDEDPDLSKDIKVIGICAGSKLKETEAYRDKFPFSFPLFCDPDYCINNKFGSPRTPFTMLVNNHGQVLFIHYGVVKDVDEFLCHIKRFCKQQCRQ